MYVCVVCEYNNYIRSLVIPEFGVVGSSIVCSETVYLTRVIVITSHTNVASVRCEFISRV
jgi:hypothetical protein